MHECGKPGSNIVAVCVKVVGGQEGKRGVFWSGARRDWGLWGSDCDRKQESGKRSRKLTGSGTSWERADILFGEEHVVAGGGENSEFVRRFLSREVG